MECRALDTAAGRSERLTPCVLVRKSRKERCKEFRRLKRTISCLTAPRLNDMQIAITQCEDWLHSRMPNMRLPSGTYAFSQLAVCRIFERVMG